MGKIYTKTGDGGMTSAGAGRIGKDSQLMETLGTLDELNSWIGYCRYLMDSFKTERFGEKGNPDLTGMGKELERMQDNIMTAAIGLTGSGQKIAGGQTRRLEKLMDRWEKKLPKLANFVYPYGPLQVARTVVRRAEREMVRLDRNKRRELEYLNRLSDALFVLARRVNFELGFAEKVWKKRK